LSSFYPQSCLFPRITLVGYKIRYQGKLCQRSICSTNTVIICQFILKANCRGILGEANKKQARELWGTSLCLCVLKDPSDTTYRKVISSLKIKIKKTKIKYNHSETNNNETETCITEIFFISGHFFKYEDLLPQT